MKILTGLIVILTLFSCKEVDCNDVKQAFYPDEYNLIVNESNIDLTWIKINGFTPISGERSEIMVHNNWKLDSNTVEQGDTIMKRKGTLDLTVHKKDTTLLFNWYCRGKPYK